MYKKKSNLPGVSIISDSLLRPSKMVFSLKNSHPGSCKQARARTVSSDGCRGVMKRSSGGNGPIFFHPRRAERGNDERRAVYLWEVNIDTAPARKMTGPGSSCVVRGAAGRSSAVNTNGLLSLKAPRCQGDFRNGAVPPVQVGGRGQGKFRLNRKELVAVLFYEN